jgi:hypothetical protein
MDENNSKWIDKLSALMRKAEDPATTEEERATIVDKVTYLMAKYGLEQDLLRAMDRTVPITVNHRKFAIPGQWFDKKASLLYTIALAFGCDAVRTRDNKVSLFGTDEDVEHTIMLYMSVAIQMDTALLIADREDRPKGQHHKTFNASFVSGYVMIVRKRIRDAAERAKEDVKATTTGNGMELVLQDKATVVQRVLREFYPKTSTTRTSWSSRSSAGYNSGHAAGQRADIGGSRVSTQHATRRAIS